MFFNTKLLRVRWEKKYICHLQLKTDIRHFEMKKYQMEKNPLFQSGFSKVKCKFVNFYF